MGLVVAVCRCRDIVFGRMVPFRSGLSEAGKNINVGFKLMIANIASLLIVGIVRMTIENKWGVATFGKVSLTMSVSNLLMVFISAVSIILFPTLRRTSDDKLAGMYDFMLHLDYDGALGSADFFTIPPSAPHRLAAEIRRSLDLHGADVPRVRVREQDLHAGQYLYENSPPGKVDPSHQRLHRGAEHSYLRADGLPAREFDPGGAVHRRAADLPLYFRRASALRDLDIRVRKDIVLEVLMTATFIATAWFLRSWLCTILYGAAYLVYVLIKRQDIARMLGQVKSLIKR